MPYEKLNLSTPKPVLSWANHPLEHQEHKMAKNVASLPFVFKHVALMPDVHLGKGALVGSVIATKEAIIPAAVGVDIGCGMCKDINKSSQTTKHLSHISERCFVKYYPGIELFSHGATPKVSSPALRFTSEFEMDRSGSIAS